MVDLSPKSTRLLIELVRREIQRLAFDAIIYEVYGIDTPVGRRNSKIRRLLKIALDELRKEPQ